MLCLLVFLFVCAVCSFAMFFEWFVLCVCVPMLRSFVRVSVYFTVCFNLF